MALIFDIETVGEKWDELDETSQKMLTRWIEKSSRNDEEYESALDDVKDSLGFSPLTGFIVAIGVLDEEKGKGAVYFQAPSKTSRKVAGKKPEEIEEGDFKLKQTGSEKDMLEEFWRIAKSYSEFVSFNGRSFDVPFLMIRSAVHGIHPSKDLMSNRYLNSQRDGAKHIDLQDQLVFYGAVRRMGSLHLY